MKLLIAVSLLACGGLAMGAAANELSVELRDVAPVWEDFVGFGAEWDPRGYVGFGVTDEDFALVSERVRWMRLPMARVMILTKWCYANGAYDWDTREMRALYRQLDLCQDLATTVFLTDWGAEREWTTADGIEGVDDPEYAEVIATYLDYLLNERGYDCIQYFIMTNEPNLEVRDFDKWKRGLLNVEAALAERGLDEHVTLVGSDTSQDATDESWHRMAVDQLHETIGVYDIHRYAQRERVRSGGLEDYWRGKWAYVREHDPQGGDKPCIVGEAGMNDDADHPRGSPHINEYGYGVFMADYAVQAARAGSAAVAAWMLDDNSHAGFYWGMWSNVQQGMALRDWFYAWSLLARYVPGGSSIYAPEQPEGVRVLAARSGVDWTVILVNRRSEDVAVNLATPAQAGQAFRQYLYEKGPRPKDAQGFPEPTGELQAAGEGALTVNIPSESVAVLTTLSFAQ